MIIHAIQHIAFETPGVITHWARENSHTLTTTHAYNGDPFPEPGAFDWLVVMGGPMGVKDEDQYPWLVEEKQVIQTAIEQRKVVLGICLGAQLIAEVLGAAVYPNTHSEIGWFPVSFSSQAQKSPIFAFAPPKTTVFHWHNDTFDLPDGAVHLTSSKACKNQAFSYENRVVGLQFHLEMQEEQIHAIVDYFRDDLVQSREAGADFVQSAEMILSTTNPLPHTNAMMRQLLANLYHRTQT